MSRVTLIVIAAVLVLILGVALMLGVFPPGPRTEQVQHVLPNDRFQPR
jgi:fumarate reductase subunit D